MTKLRMWLRRWRWYFVAGYAALLLISHIARWINPVDESPKECCAVMTRAVDGERFLERKIRVAYRDYRIKNENAATPILLLHGSPGSADDFTRIVATGRINHRLIAPDLPGFGGSTRDIPDYSIRAHARYAIELLDQLKLPRVHVVGFSMGGGVASHMTEFASERVASITLLSSIGAQEMELLGDYYANHAVHGLQLGFFHLLREGLPLTPAAYSLNTGVPYSRNFFDSDQRPLHDLIKSYAGPMLIIHGRKDFLIPVEAAIEHHRLSPQSELIVSDDNHFMVFQKPEYLAPIIEEFINRVEAGEATTRANADPARVAASQLSFDPKNLPKYTGVAAFVVTLSLVAATLVSEDLTCVTAGVMASQGRIGFALASFACFFGIFIGDLLLFMAGRWFGRAALQRAPVKWFIKEGDAHRCSEWISRQGLKMIFASRFLPGARLPTYFAAGALNTSFWKFSFYFFIACAVWTPILVGLSMFLGREVIESALLGGQSLFLKIIITGVLILALIKLLIRLSTARGRRLLVSTWRRMTRWEFWPPFVFYPPVVLYATWLMLKHRGMTVFTAANPAIPGGGFLGESKAEILRGLGQYGAYLVKWRLIEATSVIEDRIEQARAFIAEYALDFPVVLKPNVGQRGSGVSVIRSEFELEAYLRRANTDTLIQEYAVGQEFGVFYYRYPDQERGRIFAITEKRFPSVTGDGVSVLEQLILNDDRAVCMARFLLDMHAARLWETPREGDRVQLVEIGTHCRGAIFLDGEWAKTDELERAVDRICRAYDGFYFGRFDLRAGSVEDFKLGRNFKVLELNGVTSEATNIYDPKNSILVAYKILFNQWRIAFEIGAMNRERGAKPTPARTLLKWMIEHKGRNGH